MWPAWAIPSVIIGIRSKPKIYFAVPQKLAQHLTKLSNCSTAQSSEQCSQRERGPGSTVGRFLYTKAHLRNESLKLTLAEQLRIKPNNYACFRITGFGRNNSFFSLQHRFKADGTRDASESLHAVGHGPAFTGFDGSTGGHATGSRKSNAL